LPGGGSFYLFVKEELKLWASVNLFGDEIFAAQIVSTVLAKPFEELIQHSYGLKNKYLILEELKKKGYPYSYDIFSQKIIHTFKDGLIDSSKSVRGTLWNSINLVSTILTSE